VCSLLAWLVMFPSVILGAAPPQNDVCGNAFFIPGSGPFPFLSPLINIEGATITGDPPVPGFYQGLVIRSVWYRFTPALSATYRLSTCAGPGATATTADTVMALYTSAAGCNGPFVIDGELNDQACDSQAELTRQLLADTTYYLVIWKFCDNCTEDGLNALQLLVTRTLPPQNDLCTEAIPVLQNPGSLNFVPLAGTTVGARDDYRIADTNGFSGIDQMPSTAAGGDVVYSFTAPEAGEYSFKVTGYDAGQNLVLYVAASCPPAAPGLVSPLGAANRSGFNSAEEILCLPLAAGQQVFAFVDDDQAGNPGSSFIFEVTRCVREREPNDSPADAAVLSCGVEGSLSSLVDRDFFALGNYPTGWRAFAMVDGEAARNSDFDLRITTFSDTVQYDDEDNDVAFGGKSPNLAGTPLIGLPSFLFVNYNFRAPLKSEPYRVYAVVQPPLAMATPESEPNDSTAAANFSEDNYFRGRLDDALDVDLYSFNVAEGDLVFLSLDPDPHRTNALLNARLELLRADGTPLAAVNDGAFASFDGTNISHDTLTGTSPSSPGEALVYRALEEGTFFASVSISSASAANQGDYLLSISKNCRIGSDGASHPPVLTNVTIPSPAVIGVPVNVKGTIWELDTGAAPTLMVQWGDGTPNDVVEYPGSGRIDFSLPHRFTALASNLEIIVSVQDRSGASVVTNLNVRVRSFVQPALFTSIQSLGNGRIRLELTGSPNEVYRVEQREPSSPWSVLGTRTTDAAGQIVIEDTQPIASSRFYRAVAD
jgi:hypothetical protein